jgi:hypothetical protein
MLPGLLIFMLGFVAISVGMLKRHPAEPQLLCAPLPPDPGDRGHQQGLRCGDHHLRRGEHRDGDRGLPDRPVARTRRGKALEP